MDNLVLKLLLTPLLIGAASLAGRRWGPAISGWLVGLPLTSGPVIFFIALNRGQAFASAAALGILTGTISQALFCLCYGWLAIRHGWRLTLLASSCSFLLATAALQYLVLPLAPLCLTIVLALGVTLQLMPSAQQASAAIAAPPPRWDIPARMALATAFVIVITSSASLLGPHLTGLLAPFPLYASILAAFTQRNQGPLAAAQVLRGLLLALFAFAGFFTVLALLIVRMGIGAAFGGAIAAALMIHAGALWVLRRPHAGGP